MTDPIYGDNPLDATFTWYTTMRPPLVNDPEMRAWQAVATGVFDELAESSWSVRWRTKSPSTALGVHLDAFGADLAFQRPNGWDDTRYQDVLVPIEGAALGRRTPPATEAIAEGLAYGAQTWEMVQADPLTYVVYFYSVTDSEAQLYLNALRRGRSAAVRCVLVYSNVDKASTFVLDVSDLDGTDVLAKMTEL